MILTEDKERYINPISEVDITFGMAIIAQLNDLTPEPLVIFCYGAENARHINRSWSCGWGCFDGAAINIMKENINKPHTEHIL